MSRLYFSVCIGVLLTCLSLQDVEAQEKPEAKTDVEFNYLFIEGLRVKNLGDPKQAMILFAKCLEIDSLSAASMVQIAEIRLRGQDGANAIPLLKRATEISPDNEVYKLQLIQAYRINKQPIEAAQVFEQLAEQNSSKKRTEYLYTAGTIYKGAKEFNKTIEMLDKIEDELGLNEAIVFEKQQIYMALEDYKSASGEIKRLIKSDPENSTYYGLMADLFLAQGEDKKALNYYNKVLDKRPDDGFVQISLANYHLERGDTVTAHMHLDKAMVSKTLDVDTKIKMTLFLLQNYPTVKGERIKELVLMIIESAPEDDRPIYMYANLLLDEKSNSMGADAIKRAIELNPNEYEYRERLIFTELGLERSEAALKTCKSAIDRFPNEPIPHLIGASIFMQDSIPEKALDLLDKGEKLTGDNNVLASEFAHYKAEVYHQKGDLDSTWVYFDKSIALNPSNWVVLNNYAYYLSVENIMLDKAEKLSAQVIQSNPNNGIYLDTYAWILFKKKDYTLAAFYMKSAINSDVDKTGVYFEHYGDILYFSDKKDEALEYWKRAKEAGEGSDLLDDKIESGTYKE